MGAAIAVLVILALAFVFMVLAIIYTSRYKMGQDSLG
mgnify:CR=1 FL=1